MFERFTDQARVAVTSAQEEARSLRHCYVGTEHLLLALSAGEGVGASALLHVGFDRARFERAVLDEVGRGPTAPPGRIPFTPRAKKALKEGLRQALGWDHRAIGTEHLVIGLLRDDTSLGTKLLAEQSISLTMVEAAVVQLLTEQGPAINTPHEPAMTGTIDREVEEPAPPFPTGPLETQMARCPNCSEPLASNLAADIVPSVGEIERTFAVAYCRACGHTLAVLPDD